MTTIKPQFPLCFFFLLFSALLPFSTIAQTYKNISLSSSLTAQGNNSFWVSPSAEFAFGFQQIGKTGFLLAIWFNKIPEKTIVWSANGNHLAPTGSKVELTADGQLVLKATAGEQIWKANQSVNGDFVSYAAMLDTGNFVLASTDSVYLWETFKQPTDTLLPSQTMGQHITLFARYGEANYSNGRFAFILQKDGNLVSYAKHSPLDFYRSPQEAYWASNTVGNGTELIFNRSGSIYLTAKDGSIINELSSNAVSMEDFYQRAILEYDGAFRHYVYPKSTTSAGGRHMAWTSLSAVPSNMCLINVEDRGLGPCGFNSYCTNDQKPSCHCPEGFSFIDPNDWSEGCKQHFVSQSCDEAAPEKDLFYFYDMPNGDWHLSDYEQINQVTEDICRQNCLADCFCAAATYRDGNCYKKKSPLANGRMDSSLTGKTMVKTSKGGNSTFPPGGGYSNSENKHHSTLVVVGSGLLSSSAFLNIVSLVAIIMLLRFRKRKMRKTQHLNLPDMDLQCFTYEEIKIFTDDFKEEIGSGAFGKVFKGFLPSDSGNYIAVKRFNNMVAENDREFKVEVNAIARTNHRNLVKLLGFCNAEQHRLLVYEFMRNGSLASFLFCDSRIKINLNNRIQIALEIARGLVYLHEGCSTQIIHCDIKPQNILLDDNFTAKIADFGLAKLLKTEQSRTMTVIRGTKGYVAPEWFRSMPITVKVDVYSYGILLLELMCSRKCFDAEAEDKHQMVLADWAYDCYVERKLDQLMKDDKEAMEDLDRVEKYVKIAIWCIQENPAKRPTMNKVIQMIEGSVEVPIPSDASQSSFFSAIPCNSMSMNVK